MDGRSDRYYEGDLGLGEWQTAEVIVADRVSTALVLALTLECQEDVQDATDCARFVEPADFP